LKLPNARRRIGCSAGDAGASIEVPPQASFTGVCIEPEVNAAAATLGKNDPVGASADMARTGSDPT
jgi:hypothetical protein